MTRKWRSSFWLHWGRFRGQLGQLEDSYFLFVKRVKMTIIRASFLKGFIENPIFGSVKRHSAGAEVNSAVKWI